MIVTLKGTSPFGLLYLKTALREKNTLPSSDMEIECCWSIKSNYNSSAISLIEKPNDKYKHFKSSDGSGLINPEPLFYSFTILCICILKLSFSFMIPTIIYSGHGISGSNVPERLGLSSI